MLTVLDFSLIQPEIILLVTAVFVLLTDAFFKEMGHRLATICAALGLVACIVVLVPALFMDTQVGFDGQVIQDSVSVILKISICVLSLLVYVYGFYFNQAHHLPQGSYLILSLLSIIGALVLTEAQHLLLMYVGLELVTLPLLALIALPRDGLSAEAAMKYFVMSALASGFLLYGISLCYGLTGSMQFNALASAFSTLSLNGGVLFTLVFLGVGVCFKLGVVPFHMWVPDAYQGAPTSVTALLGTISKLAAFGLLFRIFIGALSGLTPEWQVMLFTIAALSVVVGNFVALVQTNIKRLFAYSAIAQMGFVLFGFAEGTALGLASALFYVVTYVLSAAAGFGVLMLLKQLDKPLDQLRDLAGLSKNHLGLAIAMLIVLFSMAGVPPFVGFDAKLLVVKALIAKGHIVFALIALLTSVVGAYYYIRMIKMMFFDETPQDKPMLITIPCGVAGIFLTVNTVLLLVLGMFPSTLLSLTQRAVI